MSVPAITRHQAIAFRLDTQGLHERVNAGEMVATAQTICMQNTPPGAASQALAARVNSIGQDDVFAALESDKSLVQAFGARGAPHVFATADAAVFTLGLLPGDEAALRAFMLGANPALDAVGISATELVRISADTAWEVLDGTSLVKDELGRAVGELLTDRIPRSARRAWTSPSTYAERQLLGESLVRFALPVLSLQGILCHGHRRGRSPLLCRTDQWLGTDPTRAATAAGARGELVRRYLRCYGPSVPEHFAAWGGIGLEQASTAWAQIRDDLQQVTLLGATAWIHRDDADRLASTPQPEGVRLLPPHDPYLQSRDRTTLLANHSLHRRVWRATGAPGVVLVDGAMVATWRPRAKGATLDIHVEPFDELPASAAGPIHEEAQRLAWHRDRELGLVEGV